MAMSWWMKSANQGNVQAMIHLAETYSLPDEGVTKDLVQAKYWWMKASEAGDTYAMCRLGECLEKGWGVGAINLEDAYKWYKLASQNGSEEATEQCKRFTRSLTGKIKIKRK